jgi:hypothetical protein
MQVPIFDIDKLVDQDGKILPQPRETLANLFNELMKSFSQEGLVMPSQTADNIAMLSNSSSGTFVYDKTNKQVKVNIDGVWKTVNVS